MHADIYKFIYVIHINNIKKNKYMLSPGRGKGLVPWPKNGMCGFKANVWFRIQTFCHERTASTDLESTISADSTYSKDRIHA